MALIHSFFSFNDLTLIAREISELPKRCYENDYAIQIEQGKLLKSIFPYEILL